MTDPDRLANLRLAQRTIVSRLDDPATPPYSIAPLTNQLRLVEKQIARLTSDDDDEGLPDPDQFGLVTALAYERWLRGPHQPARRKPGTEYALAQDEIFRSWKDAGFELSPRRGRLEEWVEEMRTELQRCLEEAE